MTKTRGGMFVHIAKWRAANKQVGIAKFDGVPYTYEHVQVAPVSRSPAYRIETYIPFEAPKPTHRNVHYVPSDRLDEFFERWGEHAETVVDIRPISIADAIKEMENFRTRALQGTVKR